MTKIERAWVTESGLRAMCAIVRGSHRCGYVGVPQDHPFHGLGYQDQTDRITQEQAQHSEIGKKGFMIAFTASVGSDGDDLVRRSLNVVIDVHGGITFSNKFRLPDVDPDLWWFGFDCAHSGDGNIGSTSDPVRSEEYVVAECESMAKQIQELLKERSV
jgi:hypothetical protein